MRRYGYTAVPLANGAGALQQREFVTASRMALAVQEQVKYAVWAQGRCRPARSASDAWARKILEAKWLRMICNEEEKWRKRQRHFLIFSDNGKRGSVTVCCAKRTAHHSLQQAPFVNNVIMNICNLLLLDWLPFAVRQEVLLGGGSAIVDTRQVRRRIRKT